MGSVDTPPQNKYDERDNKMAGTAWMDEETTKLIELCGEDEIQVQLQGCKRNVHVYERNCVMWTMREQQYNVKSEYKK